VTSTIQNFTKNIAKNGIPLMNKAALTEFSEEFQSGNMPKRDASTHLDEGLAEFSSEFQAKNIPANGEISNMNDAALTEISEELLANAINNK
jgi:hypothetical protein